MSVEVKMSRQPARKRQKKAREMKTFVLLDLETTGLGVGTRVTELSLLAYTREEFLSGRSQLRVCSKLTLCMNPERPIEPKASEMTGLTYQDLTRLPTFKSQASVVISFLKNFQGPVCLVAHNGDKFDFPLLKAELKNCGMETLFDGFLCADSIMVFKYLDLHGNQSAEPLPNSHGYGDMTSLSSSPCPNAASISSFQSKDLENPLKRGYDSLPKLPHLSPNLLGTFVLQVQDSNGLPMSPPESKKQRTGELRKSYSLQNMYQQEYGRAPDSAHTAEDDCVNLLKVIRGGKSEHCKGFVSWCDKNAKPFKKIKPF